MDKIDLDKVLVSLGGWGKFQTISYLILGSVVLFSVAPMSFIFVARDARYRCFIEHCDERERATYQTKWLPNAVPYFNQEPSRCLYFKSEDDTCNNFSSNETKICNDFVFEINQTTIIQDFDITCEENVWKLTIAGSLNELGELFCLPFAGFLSDRYGRKLMIVVSVFLTTFVGLVRSFSYYYYQYLILEFLDTALGSGMYSGAFVLALEIVDVKNRNLGNTVINLFFISGQALLGVAAWISPTWRIMLRFVYFPGFFIALAACFSSESIRWLLSKKKSDKALDVLKHAAKLNGTEINLSITEELKNFQNSDYVETKKDSSIISVFKNRCLLLRLLHCWYTWISCTFPYYGLTIQSVSLSENVYLNFILCILIEAPAVIATQKAMDRFGRRNTLACALILAAISCFAINVPSKDHWSVILIFICGKFFVTVAYTDIYIYTAEMFPTNSRHSSVALCAMFSRLGSMVAPQVPLLARIFPPLPSLIFALMTLTSGIFAFWFPETASTTLPDEIDQAVNIEGKS